MRTASLAISLLFTVVGTSSAQIPLLDKIFSNVSDVGIFYIAGRIDDNHDIRAGEPGAGSGRNGLRGFGIEASFGGGGFNLSKRPIRPNCSPANIAEKLASADEATRERGRSDYRRCQESTRQLGTPECDLRELNRGMASDDADIAAQAARRYELCQLARRDTSAIVTARTQKRNAAGEVVETTQTEAITIKGQDEDPDYDINLELALGFAQIGGFNGSDTFDLSGSLQELPSLAAYLTYALLDPVTFYASGRVGLVQLNGWRAQTSDPGASTPPVNRIYSASGTTYLVGYGVGLLGEIGRAGLFTEYTYTRRRFSSVEWSISNSNIIPAIFPKRLDLDTWTWLIGVQISFK